MTAHFADRLCEAIIDKGSPVCVGLDPNVQALPAALKPTDDSPAAQLAAVREFCMSLLDVLAPVVPAVKPQIAYFEPFRGGGVDLYFELCAKARELGLIVIADVKRGDIASSAAAYARAMCRGDDAPDAVTVNSYFGADGIDPFLTAGIDSGRGAFALVRTSNPTAASIQDLETADGRKVYEHMAAIVADIGSQDGLIGQCGYSALGAVVGATWPEQARLLREIMPQQVFLVPGYGAQGASAADCAASFKADGTGAIVNASRSVIYAFMSDGYTSMDWKHAVQAAALAFKEDIRQALGL